MFGRRKNTPPPEQIPYSLYETLQKDSGRHGRWVFETLLAGVIVLILLLGGVLLYRTVHNAKTPSPTQSTDVTQSPQTNANPQSSGQPVSTPAGKSTNNQNIAQPNQ